MQFMKDFFNLIYKEDNSILNLSVSLSGIVSLIVYCFTLEIMFSILSFLISFPLIKELFKSINLKYKIKNTKSMPIAKLTCEEFKVVEIFVNNGVLVVPEYRFEETDKFVLDSLIVKEYAHKEKRGDYEDTKYFAYIITQETFDFVLQRMGELGYAPISDAELKEYEESQKSDSETKIFMSDDDELPF